MLFVFLDGVGLGSSAADVNPFAAASTPVLTEVLGGPLTNGLVGHQRPRFTFRPLDATLGHPGLPQSATGQASLLTGRNAVRVMNRHYGPWPGPTLQRMLTEGNLFSEFRAAGRNAMLANAYPPRYLQALTGRKLRTNAFAFAQLGSGGRLPDLADYAAGSAVSADLTGVYLHSLDPAGPVLTPERSGALLAQLALKNDLTVFDFWLSDQTGHRGSFTDAVELISQLDEFLGGVFASAANLTVLITSDHGNLEDKSVRTHTRAPVPLIVSGTGAPYFQKVNTIAEVAPAIRRLAGIETTQAD